MTERRRLLLDTHVFLWWRVDSPRLGSDARAAIRDADEVFISAASAWEVAIKIALGRLRLPEPFGVGVEDSGFAPLDVSFRHAAAVQRLEPHHRDPFDRMLVAQTAVEALTLVTDDRQLEPYGVPLLPA